MKLFERGRIGRLEAKNRIAMAPMGTNGLTDIRYRLRLFPQADRFLCCPGQGGCWHDHDRGRRRQHCP
jgi:hypothetical protein